MNIKDLLLGLSHKKTQVMKKSNINAAPIVLITMVNLIHTN
jgi:hypothetical protein